MDDSKGSKKLQVTVTVHGKSDLLFLLGFGNIAAIFVFRLSAKITFAAVVLALVLRLLPELQLLLQEPDPRRHGQTQRRGEGVSVQLENVEHRLVLEQVNGFEVRLEGSLGGFLQLVVTGKVGLDLSLNADDLLRVGPGMAKQTSTLLTSNETDYPYSSS